MSIVRSMLAATGFPKTWTLFAAAMLLVVLFPDNTIDRIGPIDLQPDIRVITVAPLLVALAVGIAYGTGATPVVTRGVRVTASRLSSFVASLSCALVIVAAAALISGPSIASALLRNTLWVSGVALITAALSSSSYVWLPIIVLFATTVIMNADEEEWSLCGLLFRSSASGEQLLASAAALAVGLAVHLWNPRNHECLPRRRA